MAEQHPLRILLAEDNAVNRMLALQILRRLGYHADVAEDGHKVLAALERQPYLETGVKPLVLTMGM